MNFVIGVRMWVNRTYLRTNILIQLKHDVCVNNCKCINMSLIVVISKCYNDLTKKAKKQNDLKQNVIKI